MNPLLLENALFGGIEPIIAYYEPLIHHESSRNEDRSRATLNYSDIAQECRRVILRCWTKQRLSSDVKNFDILVKIALKRAILSMRGKEYAPKRGRFAIPFFSELTLTSSGEERDLDSALGPQEQRPSYDKLVLDITSHLPCANLQRTFRHIVEEEEPEYLNAQQIPPPVRARIATTLKLTEHQLLTHLDDISFILRGFQPSFCG